jgi:hypothetical protein
MFMHRFDPKDFINYLALSIPVEGLFQKHVKDTKLDIYVVIFIIIFITFKIVSLKCWGQQLKLFLVFFCKSKNYKSEFVKYVSPFRHDWQNLHKICIFALVNEWGLTFFSLGPPKPICNFVNPVIRIFWKKVKF